MSAVAHDRAAPAARSVELADVFARYGQAYQNAHPLSSCQRKAVRAILHCRTAALGGHRDWCEQCGFERFVYHSCRNRHCPKCQSLLKAAWLEARRQELLPVPYFHNVFTLPHELNALILWSERNQRALLGLLFDAAAQTLLEFGRRELSGKLGFTMVLHTWDQQLRAHFHLHCLIACGALAEEGSRWIAGGSRFLFPVRALSQVFRAKFLDRLSQLLRQGQLDIPPHLGQLLHSNTRQPWLRRLRKKPWVVYSKPPFAGPAKLLDYLGRYTHRVAISNQRLISCQDGQVSFGYRDRRDGDRRKIATVPADEFIRRFLQHILPDGFRRIRQYGFLANCVKKECLAQCRQLLGAKAPDAPAKKSVADWMNLLLGIDITRCPCCGAALCRESLAPLHAVSLGTPQGNPVGPARIDPWDSS
jgi:hypothetical protein